MRYTWEWAWVYRHLDLLIEGLGITLLLTFGAVVFGLALAVAWALMRSSRSGIARGLGGVLVEVFRDLPVLVLLVWMYFCLPLLFPDPVRMSPFWIAVVGLGLNFGALEAEIIRAGYDAIPRGEIEVSKSFNFSRWQITRHVILPQAFWRSLAPTLGQVVNTLKLSALASFIAVPEVFYISQKLIQETFRPLEFYSALALLYLLLILPFSLALQHLQSRLQARFGSDV